MQDEEGLLFYALTKLTKAQSALDAKLKSLEWAVTFVSIRQWKYLCFSTDALEVMNDINSARDPLGWFSKDSILCIRALLSSFGWGISWNAKSSNKFADFIATKALAIDCNVLYCSFNLGNLSKDLSDIYVSYLMGRSPL